MDNFWDEIPVPTEAEKDAAVCQILDAGLPARPGLWHTLELLTKDPRGNKTMVK